MDIKMIAMDLDGTLLTTDKRLSERTKRVLFQAAEKGIYIVPATGRSLTGLAPEVKALPFIRYAITVNGAAVWDMERQELVAKQAFSKQEALMLWDFISGYHTMLDACIDGKARMAPEYYERIEEFMQDEPRSRLLRSTRTSTKNLRELIADERTSVEKFNLFFREDEEERRVQAREELNRFGKLSVTSSLGNNLEINHIAATKGKGLFSLAAHLGLSMDQTMAFGDGENDSSMLLAAGIGVAMENAPEEVKAVADLVTLSNDEEGVAYSIEKYVLKIR